MLGGGRAKMAKIIHILGLEGFFIRFEAAIFSESTSKKSSTGRILSRAMCASRGSTLKLMGDPHALPAPELVYTSVDDVPVPPETPPGGTFTALVKPARAVCPRRVKLWRATGQVPIIVTSQRQQLPAGARWSQRPSAQRRQQGGRRRGDAATSTLRIEQWSTAFEMEPELHEEDIGWQAGPVGGPAGRPRPAFTGPRPGPRGTPIDKNSSATAVMRRVMLTPQRQAAVLAALRGHAAAWSAAHAAADSTEAAFDADDVTEDHLTLYYCAEIRAAMLNPALPVASLWDKDSILYDPELDARLPYHAYAFLHRHISFGVYGDAADAASDAADAASGGDSGRGQQAAGGGGGQRGFDSKAKRRLVADLSVAAAGAAFNPGQDVGFDDMIRPTRHGDGKPTQNKPTMSGKPYVALNCADTNYYLYWEEQGWLSDHGITTRGPAAARGVAGGDGGDAACRSAGDGGDGSGGSGGSGGDRRAGVEGGGGGGGGGEGGDGEGGSGSRGAARVDGGRAREGDAAAATNGDGDGSGGSGGGAAGDGAADGGSGGGGDGGDDGDDVGVNSVIAKIQRAAAVLTPHVGHCIWSDRGLGHVAAAKWLAAHGYHYTFLCCQNRVGLPRRMLAKLIKQLSCPSSCTHQASSRCCQRWSWTCMHKGEMELQLWSDGKAVVIAISDCTSATRTIEVARTLKSNGAVIKAQAPEGIGLYTTVFRSPTDTGDQKLKRLNLTGRRRVRQGPKCDIYDFAIGLVNGHAMLSTVAPLTVWQFAMKFYREGLAAISLRERVPAALRALTCGAADEAPVVAAAAARTRAQSRAHVPRCFAIEWAAKRRRGEEAPSRHAARGGTCAAPRCENRERPTLYCPGCDGEPGRRKGWYHFDCFFRMHAVSYRAE